MNANQAGWVERHSINCYRCGRLADERECLPNEAEYGGNGDGGELCPDCVGSQGDVPLAVESTTTERGA